LPDNNGYGGVLWGILTYYEICRFPKFHRLLSRITNLGLGAFLMCKLQYERIVKSTNWSIKWTDYQFYFTHFCINHGFCAWAKK
jgi:hypothetical protein